MRISIRGRNNPNAKPGKCSKCQCKIEIGEPYVYDGRCICSWCHNRHDELSIPISDDLEYDNNLDDPNNASNWEQLYSEAPIKELNFG